MTASRRGARLGRWLAAAQWPLVGFAALLALALGAIGFARHFAAQGEPRPLPDLLYLALQLFTLESGALRGPLPWQLEAARLLAPTVAGYAAVRALTLVFRDQWQELKLRRCREHVVICGLGRKGARLAGSLCRRGDRVVAIEKDAENDFIDPLRAAGALVLVGDARGPGMLRRARLARAAHLLALCGEDGANAEVAIAAREEAGDRERRALPCRVHVVDPRLCELLRLRELERPGRRRVRLEFFNLFETGARILVREHPPDLDRPGAPRVVVAGLGRLGENVVLRLAAEWRAAGQDSRRRLRVTLADREAEARLGSLLLRHPHLAPAAALEAETIDLGSARFQSGEFLGGPEERREVAAVYVCVDDDSLGLAAGLGLARRLEDPSVPVVVRTERDAGLASLLDGMGGGELANLRAFGLLDRTCTPELLSSELLARRIHQRYRESMLAAGETPDTKPAMVPWERLGEGHRESNRQQADHIGEKLAAVGCRLVPLRSWEAAGFVFARDEVERLAALEHQRWCEERRRQGWTRGERDEDRRRHPHLVPYDELPDEVRELDRATVEQLPELLAEAGFEIVRR